MLVTVALVGDVMTYEYLETLAPDDQLDILRTEHSLEGVDCRTDKRTKRGWGSVEEGSDDRILEFERPFFLHGYSVLDEVDDVCMTSRTT